MASPSATTSSDAHAASAIARRFAALGAERRPALVCYATAGHPSRDASLELLCGLEEEGADVIEVGVPFSDPMADGPVIQASSQRGLDQGMTFDGTLELIARAGLSVPLVLFTYLNPLLAAGADAVRRAAEAGAHGILVTDLPLGADPAREAWLGEGPLDFVRLVAPTTPTDRMREIAAHGRGFVYLISRTGVTGARDDVPSGLGEALARLRGATSLPICVGFGVSTPAQAATIGRLADGVVVGSAIVRAADADVASAVRLVGSLRAALDAPR